MPTPPNEESSAWIIKILVYAVGVAIGLASRLASMHRKKAITLQEAVVNAAIALAAAWIVYNLLEYSGHKEIANVASVVCGRYADDVLKMGWDLIKKFLGNLDEQVNNKK